MRNPVCPYCDKAARLVARAEVERDRPHGLAWVCWPCEAWAAVHNNSPTNKPTSRLAKRELHAAKAQAAGVFNLLYKTWGVKRSDAYSWLAEKMGISSGDCDFAKFDLNECRKADSVARKYIPDFKPQKS